MSLPATLKRLHSRGIVIRPSGDPFQPLDVVFPVDATESLIEKTVAYIRENREAICEELGVMPVTTPPNVKHLLDDTQQANLKWIHDLFCKANELQNLEGVDVEGVPASSLAEQIFQCLLNDNLASRDPRLWADLDLLRQAVTEANRWPAG